MLAHVSVDENLRSNSARCAYHMSEGNTLVTHQKHQVIRTYGYTMKISPTTVAEEHTWVLGHTAEIVEHINVVRSRLSTSFNVSVEPVTDEEVRNVVNATFADGDLAVNITAIIRLLRDLDVEDDYPGFIVDEILGRELAAMIAGKQPLRLLAEATFHYADAVHHPPEGTAGTDDLEVALAAGIQTRLPGWEWTTQPCPFAIDGTEENGETG